MNRVEFLQKFGLNHDPFNSGVAEEELDEDMLMIRGLKKAPGSSQGYFSYYFTFPRIEVLPHGKRILSQQNLREEKHFIIYGKPGTGKTTLRVNFETEIRQSPKNSLVVTMLLDRPETPEEHKQMLARAIAGDLFIQICEQYTPSADHEVEKRAALDLRTLAKLAEYDYRLLDAMTDAHAAQDSPMGAAVHWSLVNKRPVKYVSYQAIAPILERMKAISPLEPEDPLAFVLQTAHVWGYQQIFMLVDSVDNFSPDTNQMMDLLRPIFLQMQFWANERIYFRFFLTKDMRSPLQKFLRHFDLSIKMTNARIIWNQSSLQQIIAKRFWAADSHLVNLTSLADDPIRERLEKKLFEDVDVPREILQRIELLIDVLASEHPEATKINESDLLIWEKKLESDRRLMQNIIA